MLGPRVLTVREWLHSTSAALGLPTGVFLEQVDVGAAHAALEAPAVNYHGQLLHTELPEQASVLVGAMLTRPPVPRLRRPLAFSTLVLFLAHNGMELQISQTQRDAFLSPTARDAVSQQDLATWIRTRMRATGAGISPTLGSPASPMPLAFIAMPVCGVRDNTSERERLQRLAGALDHAMSNLHVDGDLVAVKVEIAAIEYGTAAGERLDDADETDAALSELLSPESNDRLRSHLQHLLAITTFLVIIGDGVGSFGAGNEFGRVGRGTPVLYLNPTGTPLSRWLDDRAQFAHLEVLEFDRDEDAVAAVEEWFGRWLQVVQRRWRERQVRMLRAGPVASRLAEAWGGLTLRDARRDAFLRTGLPVDSFTSLFSPDGVAAASFENLHAMADGLGLDLISALAGQPTKPLASGPGPGSDIEPLTRREYGAFLTAWDVEGWVQAVATDVLEVGRGKARRRIELAGAGVEARQSLNQYTAWIRIGAEL